jgi:uncharacterized membrane protein
LSWGSGDLVSTISSKRAGYYATTVYSSLLGIPVLLALILISGASTGLTSTDWVILSIASLCYLSSYLFAYRGYSSAPLSVVAPIAYTAPAIAALLAVLFLGAKLTAIEGVPLVAIMAGVILLSTKFSDLRKSAGNRGRSALTFGVGSGLGASISFSFVFVALSAVVPEVGYLMPVLVLKSGGALAGLAFSPITKQDIRPNRKTVSLLVFGVAVFDTVGYLFLGAGLASAGASLPLVIMTSGMGGFFLVCYGILLRSEKPEPNQLVGILVSIVGVAALLYLTA